MLKTHPLPLTPFRASTLIVLAAIIAICAALLVPALSAEATSTGALFPTANTGATCTNPSNGHTNGSGEVTCPKFSNADTFVNYTTFNASIPGSSSVLGIQVQLDDTYTQASNSNDFICVSLSWNNGANFTSEICQNELTTSSTDYFLGSASNLWGHAWTPSELSNANFRVKVRSRTAGTGDQSNKFDSVQVTIEYSYNVPDPVVNNPGLPNECVGADVHLVIDSSGSIGASLGSMQTAIKNMADQVEAQLPASNWRGTTFRDPDGSAPVINSSAGGWQTATTNTKTLIDGMTSNGYTPTAHGIANAITGGTNGPQPNIMVIITDGAPNVVYPGGNAPPANYEGGADDAIEQAELARAAGWNTIVVMFGPGDASAPGGSFVPDVLQGLAGPIANPGPPGDVYSIENASNLGAAIAAALLANCQGSITIEKQTTPNGATQSFNFTGTPGNFSLQDNQTELDDNLTPGQVYTYTETVPSGWTLSGITCSGGVNVTITLPSVSIDLENAEDVHCTFNNTQLNTIQICKNVVPDGDTSAWNFTVTGPTPGSAGPLSDNGCQTLSNRAAGSYTVAETTQTGYTTTVNCGSKGSDIDHNITFMLNSGENVSCTFTNTSTASIQVCKNVIPDDATTWNFSLTGPTAGTANNIADGACQTFTNRAPGNYTLTETTQAGYSPSVSCTAGNGSNSTNTISFALSAGETTVCTFTNQGVGTIQICKDVVPNDSSTWSFTVTGPTAGSAGPLADGACQTLTGRNAGSYTVAETTQTGYTTTVNCGANGTDVDHNITFALSPGEDALCTFTNTSTASIQVCKDVVPNDATTWLFTLAGPTGGSTPGVADGACFTFGSRAPGSYTLTETTQAGYSTSVSCTAGNGTDVDADITFALSAGETTTCTFTNTGIGSIQVCKDVVPNDATTWNFAVAGTSAGTVSNLADGACQTLTNRTAGSYTITETTQAGYATSVNCGANGSNATNAITFALSPGENAVCTYTNTGAGSIQVCKDVVPNDATLWSFAVAGPSAGTVSNLADGACQTLTNRTAGSYTVTETTQAGYATSVNCGANGSNATNAITFTLSPGEAAVCTYTNTGIGSIQICKDVVPNDASTWNFAAAGPTAGTVSNLADGVCQTLTNRTAGSYTVTETTQAGYATSVNCGANGSNATNAITFTLSPGEAAVCTYTNTSTSSIQVCKDVVPSDGTLTSWLFGLTGPTPGSSPALNDNGCHTFGSRAPGSYTLTETTQSGYTTSVLCNGDNGSDADGNITFTLASGEAAICTFTNTSTASVQVCKDVVPNDSSTWNFTVTGPSGGSAGPLADGACQTLTSRTPGSYTVTETTQSGYTTSVNCGANGSNATNTITFALSAGEAAICTFTNTSTASIQVCKDVQPNNATTWNFTLAGPTAGSAGPLADGACSTFANRAPGSYTLTETTQAGYDTSVSCTAGNGSNATNAITFALSPGETTICTFTNVQQGTIQVCKDVVPNDASTWNFTVTGPDNGTAGPLADGGCQTLTGRSSGSYTVAETTQAGYSTSVNCGANGSNATNSIVFTLDPGENAVCTFTNTAAPGSIQVCKNVVPDGDTSEWDFTVAGPTPGTVLDLGDTECGTLTSRAAGSYTITETAQTGYTTSVVCSGDNGSDIDADIAFTLAIGESATCTFTNTSTASVQVCKDVVPDDATTWLFTLAGPTAGSSPALADGVCHTFTNRAPGSYTLTETMQAGYATSVNCGPNGTDSDNNVTFALDPGENAVCTFTNTGVGSIQVCKDVVPDDASTWNFTVAGPSGGPVGPVADGACQTLTGQISGSYTVTEATQAGYSTSVNCGANGSNATNAITFTLSPGEAAVCTYTNTGIGSIQVCKDVVPNDATTWNFTVAGPSAGSVNNLADGACQTLTNRTAGSYTVTEGTQAGYATSVNCGANGSNATNAITFTLSPGEAAICTYTNTGTGTIEVCKDVVPNDASTWNFSVTGPSGGPVGPLADGGCQTLTNQVSGSYTVAETTQPGYTTSVNCGANGSEGDADLTFTVSPGENASCTFTNTGTASVQVCKDVVPGDASTWTFTLAGPTGGVSPALGDTQCYTFGNRAPGAYTLTEATQSNYTTSVNCGPNGSNGSNAIGFTLDAGENAVCTFTNTAVGEITVCKDVVPNDASTWNFSVTGPSGGAVGPLGDGQCLTLTNQTTGAYTVAETTQAGYSTSVDCGANGSNGTNTINITLDLGEAANCMFTNTSNASVEVCKNVVPDDGGLTQWDFMLGGPTAGGVNDLVDNGCHNFTSLAPGSYTLAEITQTGYATSVNCGVNGSDADENITFSLDPGEAATCTFTNTSTASIEICKEIEPPDASTWNFTVTGPSGGAVGPLADGQCQTLMNQTPGSYTVAETTQANYSTAVNCGGNGSEADADLTFALSPGENAVCTFTNTANAGSIQICKDVVPNDASTWNFTVGGPSAGVAGPLGDGQCQTLTNRTPGSYTVTETTQAGYTASVNCGPNGNNGTATITFTVSPGEAASCTFTNTAQTGSIQVCKEIVPPDASTWNFSVAGPTAGSAGPLGDGQCQTLANRVAGSYTITETTQSGYTTAVACNGDNGADSDANITFALAPGENAVCTFTNTAVPASIQVCKNVEPTDASTWNFTVTGPSGGPVGPLGDGQCQTLSNRTPGGYTITETTQLGYATTVDCGANGSDTDANITFTLTAGEAAACTFTNTGIGSIQICKEIEPPDASTWNFTVAGPTAGIAGPLGDGQCQTLSNRTAGNYTVTETTQVGYTTTVNCGPNGSDTDNNITFALSAGETALCTFTNTANPVLSTEEFLVYKDFTDNNAMDVTVSLQCTSGTVVQDDPSASETDAGNFTVEDALPGTTCTASEIVPGGYVGNESACVNVLLTVGSCTIVNEPATNEGGGTPNPVGGEAGLIDAEPPSSSGSQGAIIALTAMGLAGLAGAVWAMSRRRAVTE